MCFYLALKVYILYSFFCTTSSRPGRPGSGCPRAGRAAGWESSSAPRFPAQRSAGGGRCESRPHRRAARRSLQQRLLETSPGCWGSWEPSVQGRILLAGSIGEADSDTSAVERADSAVREPVLKVPLDPLLTPTPRSVHRHHFRDVSLRVTSEYATCYNANGIPKHPKASSLKPTKQRCLRGQGAPLDPPSITDPKLQAEGGGEVTTEAAPKVAPYPCGFNRACCDSARMYLLRLTPGEPGTPRFCRFPALGPAQAARLLPHTDLICSDRAAEMLPHKSILLAVKNEPNELH